MNTANLTAMRYHTALGEKHARNHIFVDLAAQGSRILELGCADGFISKHLVKRGCIVTGVEVDAEAAEHAKKWCEKVFVCDLNRPGWSGTLGRDFDTVLCGDVLEHLVDPWSTLREISKVLTKERRVIISLPNIANLRIRLNLLMGRFNYQPGGILDITHLRFFTLKTARELIEESGYRIVSFHPVVGGRVTRPIRLLFPRLFAGQMIFVAVPA
jgi:2-polyprenyl-3-methyl-5-hydroxy-6-metoxy-1,4-benzoquinol methylase